MIDIYKISESYYEYSILACQVTQSRAKGYSVLERGEELNQAEENTSGSGGRE